MPVKGEGVTVETYGLFRPDGTLILSSLSNDTGAEYRDAPWEAVLPQINWGVSVSIQQAKRDRLRREKMEQGWKVKAVRLSYTSREMRDG
jgi:hypothetical protein